MTAKFHPPLASRSRLLAACALTLVVACGEPEDDGPGYGQVGNGAQGADAGFVDTGVAIGPVVTPDAGSGNTVFDAGSTQGVPDAGNVGIFDAGGPINPVADAGSVDAGHAAPDAGPAHDAGASGDGGACALTYENFGKQFMTTYCVSCHSGAAAKHNVQLDTLAGVQKNKTQVKRQAVTTTVMPEANPKPMSAERQKLGQWLDCGAN